MRLRRRLAWLVLGWCLLSAAAVGAAEPSAAEVFAQLYPKDAPPTPRYLAGHPDAPISYGMEAEFIYEHVPALMDWYRNAEMEPNRWFSRKPSERLLEIPNTRGQMVRTSLAPTFLARVLSREYKRGELVTLPTDTLESALAQVDVVEAKTGTNPRGESKLYWQGNVAYLRRPGFTRQHRRGILGYLNLTADYAQFYKLHKGHEIAEQHAGYLPAASFLHHSLGPMNIAHQKALSAELDASLKGESSGLTGHYLQGTYFRTWGYEGDGKPRDGFEIRDPHHELTILEREMRRQTAALEFGFAPYAAFAGVRMHNEKRMGSFYVGDVAKLPDAVQGMLKHLKYRAFDGSDKYVLAERYGWPLRPIEQDYAKALRLSPTEAKALRARVEAARAGYLRSLEALANDKTLDNAPRLYGVHRALAKYAHDTQLYPLIERHMAKLGRTYLQMQAARGRARAR